MKPFDLCYKDLIYTIVHVEGQLYFADTGHVFTFLKGRYVLYLEPKYIISNGCVTKLSYCPDGMWKDYHGTAYGLNDQNSFYDQDPRAGVWPFELPLSSPITDASRPHDARFSIPLYQMFHTEQEANEAFAKDLKSLKQPVIVRRVLKLIVDQLGYYFWDNKKTQLK